MKNLPFILLLLACLCAKAQDTPAPAGGKLREIVVAVDSFWNKIPVEKVHIQLDKPYYALGDTLWMKAYIVNENNQLSPLSKILYADLIDDKDSVKVNLRLPVTDGMAWGTITLTDSVLLAGTYHLRAYTNLMRNFGNEYFFDKTISISDAAPAAIGPLPIFSNTKNNVPVNTDISLQFFPEGGDLVNGLPSNIAFKALGTDGLGKDVTGTIVDKSNQQVATFKSERAGMGSFMLQPVAGNTYTAVFKLGNGAEKRVELPKALPEGYVLSVSQNDESVIIKVYASNNLVNTGEIMLVAQANNAIQYTGAKKLTQNSFTAVLPKKRFPEGVLQFTLFSAGKKPVAERLVFIRRSGQRLNIKVSPDKPDYKQRDKVRLSLDVTRADGKPAVGILSMAITDEGKLPFAEVDEKTIFSNLLLTSGLKGFIEQPNYYFTDTSATKAHQLDNLLLTQGWRRFVWKDVLANNFPALTYQVENGTGVSGKILNSKGKPAPGAKVFLLASIGEGILIDTVANAQGRFIFDDLAFPKGVKFNVTATDAKGKKNVTVEVDKENNTQPPAIENIPDELPFGELLATNAQAVVNQPPVSNKQPALNNNRVNNLNEVVINEKKKASVMDVALQYSQTRAPADQVVTFVDMANCTNLGGCLAGKLTNVRVVPTTNGSFTAFNQDLRMLILIDGRAPVGGELSTISPDQIAAVEVIKGARAGNLYGGIVGGAINITLKRGGVDYQSYIDEHETDRLKSVALKEIVIKAEKAGVNFKQIATKYSSNLAGPGNADQVLTFMDMFACQYALADCLSGRLTGVVIREGKAYSRGFDTPMFVVVDGTPGRDLAGIMSSDVASVEVLRGGGAASLYGHSGGNGVLIITTKRGDVNYDSYAPGFHNLTAKKAPVLVNYKFQSGYDLRRKFYSPDYTNPAAGNQKPDLRTTIYWNPNIITDDNGKATVEFFNADAKGSYRVITEGLGTEGTLGREVYRYIVK